MNAEVVVDQFSRQAASFARLPSHQEATELLLDMAGVGAGCDVLDVACGPGMVACAAAGLRELRTAAYLFSIDLERLLRASFPAAGDKERVRAFFEADLGVDRMGLGLQRKDGVITLTYPVAIVAGSKGP